MPRYLQTGKDAFPVDMESLVQQVDGDLPSSKGEAEWHGETRFGPVRVVSRASDVDESVWRGSFSGECLDQRYYKVVEGTLHNDFDFRYAVLTRREGGERVVQPFFLVDQDIAAGVSGSVHDFLEKVRGLLPRLLTTRILMVGCAAGEGALGSSAPWAVAALHEAMDAYARYAGASIVMVKDLPAKYRGEMMALEEAGYRRVSSMPGATLRLDFSSFEEFLETRLSRIYRKGLRRKFRNWERFGGTTMEAVADLTPYLAEIKALYRQTYDRSPLKFEQLKTDYFVQLARCLPDRARFFIWRHQGRIVAFSACLLHNGVLHDLNVGLDYSVALDLHLYFITWRDLITWAIGEGAEWYYTGPLNYDPKLHLKMELVPLDLYARYLSPLINPIFGFALNYLQPARHDPVLARFPNAGDL